MEAKLGRSGWNLPPGGIISVTRADNWEVTLEHGRAWLTLEGYSQDKWLSAGERFRIPAAGHLVIETDRESRIRLDPPPASALARYSARLATGARQVIRAITGATVYSAERMGCHPAR